MAKTQNVYKLMDSSELTLFVFPFVSNIYTYVSLYIHCYIYDDSDHIDSNRTYINHAITTKQFYIDHMWLDTMEILCNNFYCDT